MGDVRDSPAEVPQLSGEEGEENKIVWERRYSREVLQQDTGRREGNLSHILLLAPVQYVLDVLLFNVETITFTYGCFQQDANGQRQLLYRVGKKGM